ncbi:lasso peptide biosynthesis PqqD family chaperone [Streptomyces sp. NPDC092307]|uniref:lasso peptide biosynthesis PqqD family chaperone n=1 Tax=Streptomyces sp. NPDC092307 TaxID=3366013 RepID=UPI003800CDA5
MNMRLRADISTADTDDGMVLLDERDGRYWQLNHSGTKIMKLLLSGHANHDVITSLVAEYHISHDRAEDDVTSFVRHLQNARLVAP